jgi:hypothetical protein
MSHPPRDHTRMKGLPREVVHASSGVDLGHEPPLNPSGEAAQEVDKRDINLRWLGASILTGVTGAALIGASIYIALKGGATTALPPDRAAMTPIPYAGSERAATASNKGDRLNMTELVSSAKQSFKAPMTIRNGDREAIKVRQFVRIATNLSLTSGTYASDIPAFNPARLMAEGNQERIVEARSRPPGHRGECSGPDR